MPRASDALAVSAQCCTGRSRLQASDAGPPPFQYLVDLEVAQDPALVWHPRLAELVAYFNGRPRACPARLMRARCVQHGWPDALAAHLKGCASAAPCARTHSRLSPPSASPAFLTPCEPGRHRC